MEVGVLVNTGRLLNVFSLLLLVAFLGVLASVRREWIRVEYSVSWLLAVGSLLFLSRWRWLHEWLAIFVGVGNGAFALILVAGCAFLVVVYRLSIRISGLRDSNIKLAQQLAVLQLRLEILDEKNKTAATE
jgi:hypothetical protein